MLKLGVGIDKVNMAVFGGSIVIPDMLAQWVGDDSPQTVSGSAFDPSGQWVDRVSGITLQAQAATVLDMYNTAFGGEKAIKAKSNSGGYGPSVASPCGISTTVQDYTMFFVQRPIGVTTPNKSMFHSNNATKAMAAYYWHTAVPTKSGQFYDQVNWSAYIGDGLVGDIDVDTDLIFTIDMQGSDSKFYKNGVLFSTNAGQWESRTINDGFAVLSNFQTQDRINESLTAEIRIYPALTDEQRAAVESELAATYSITL